ncbi:tRNA (adenosine(37)-N6)-threonylcarbamoyltransferase complex ATPase subunit type 1 TsaE [endosymbiont GvMRE of Glomus versiforme]|uniref:tRNA (adenosine(37)-N6)-threonylcarbamoyltransferase complex ATPase subunit type 1 TsaE n=1 Tax=endosymbiont GvMRE of Glomus versiforme TaxID=2039283 RepID=UPI000ED4CF6D|nr:tRNA (adenosine(37)-N6)-threonylcarbamoyltransferase complex ATPase subunit type 1 TsaE [endosymbiont GvMRE of Glomus versiforme]RHZ37005.1 tRNA threonylcarbamoyladenosine biosynthesis protein TsaE [endosymbiont GvMRE of Glomus versiforme]
MLPNQSFVIKNLTDLENLADFILPYLQPDIFLLLQGELGTGKTTFTQIIAKKLGIKQTVNSPTFTILQQYKIRNNYYLNHFDFFRLTSQDNLSVFEELTINNLNVIEWPEKNPQFWQNKEHICLTFKLQFFQEKELRLVEVKWNN